jgi:hypothetical protein
MPGAIAFFKVNDVERNVSSFECRGRAASRLAQTHFSSDVCGEINALREAFREATKTKTALFEKKRAHPQGAEQVGGTALDDGAKFQRTTLTSSL